MNKLLRTLSLALTALLPLACADADTDPTGEQDAALEPADITGEWRSGSCEIYPDGMGGENYLQRSFEIDASEWHLDLDLFADPECGVPLFSVVIDGPYELLGESELVSGATEGNFSYGSIVWTAHLEDMATLFTDSGCGATPWVVGEPQDVSDTGCIGFAHPIADCPTDHDLISLEGDALFFGQRVTDMCEASGRPVALNDYAVERQ